MVEGFLFYLFFNFFFIYFFVLLLSPFVMRLFMFEFDGGFLIVRFGFD